MRESVPSSSTAPPPRDSVVTFTAPAASAAATEPSSSSGRVKITEIGCTWVTTTMPVVSAACTMLPGSTRRMPVRPLRGELIDEGVLSVDGLLAGEILGLQLRVALEIALRVRELGRVLHLGRHRL